MSGHTFAAYKPAGATEMRVRLPPDSWGSAVVRVECRVTCPVLK
eukprot:COSAG02_NODE_42147_length_387_cov_0.895833_1_plen_43_part_01